MELVIYRLLNLANIMFAIGVIVLNLLIVRVNPVVLHSMFSRWVLVCHITVGIGWTVLYGLYILEPWIGYVSLRVFMVRPLLTFTLANVLSGAILHYKAARRREFAQDLLPKLEQEKFNAERDR